MLDDHSKYINHCFKIAKKGSGLVSPNPLVGAVLVKNEKVIGTGWHKKFGDAHAEINAIKNADENIEGSTLYCNLEPCCHTNKKTPPCVPFIIQNKIKRVVISNLDPNPDVNGKGIKQLRDAGIEVITGILDEEGKDLNKFYFKFAQEKLPYITLKIAQSNDGKINLSNKKQTWLTGKKSREYVHKLRSEYDSVLVGANTIKIDDPLLTVREVKGRNPVRIIIDGKLSIPIKSKVLNNSVAERTWIFTSETAGKKKLSSISERGVKIFQLKSGGLKKLDLKKIIQELTVQKISSVLVEGGGKIFNQFIEQDLFDEIIVLQSPKKLGKGISIQNIKKMKNLNLLSSEKLGSDIKLVYGRKYSN